MHAPITALYAGLLALLFLFLAARVVMVRRSTSIGLGDGGNAVLLTRIRIHGNAAEYVPLALLLMLILEVNGASARRLHWLGIVLVIGRIAHAQGLSQSSGTTPGRLVGNVLTWGVMLFAAVASIRSY
ncbi:MAG: MAPEG family protein [Deltaproteobacteria bacterium]|nr:MAPEG family protein [Deltaproteobacteria bacterium]